MDRQEGVSALEILVECGCEATSDGCEMSFVDFVGSATHCGFAVRQAQLYASWIIRFVTE